MLTAASFRTDLLDQLDNYGIEAVPDLFIKIDSCNLKYDKAKFNTLRSTSLTSENYITVLKIFIGTISEKRESPLQEEFFSSGEINKIAALEPGSLLIYIKENKFVYLRPPSDMGNHFQYEITEERFSQKVTGILQRLLLEDSMREDEYEILGTSLFKRLFSSNHARQEICRLIDERNTASTLKIILYFDDASSELACLPWEYLYLPEDKTGGGYFAGAKKELILTRRLSAKLPGTQQPFTTGELKILIAVSKNLSENINASAGEKKEEIQIRDVIESLNDHAGGKKISCIIKEFADLNQLADFIRNNDVFHVVHFIGLARLNADVQTDDKFEVALTSQFALDMGKVTWMGHNKFIACFDKKMPTLFFLHASKDSKEDAYLSLSGLAFHLVKKVAGVLAIQAPLNSLGTVKFSTLIYKALIHEGADLDIAVKNSLREMANPLDGQHNAKAYGITAIFSKEALRLNFNRHTSEGDQQLREEEAKCSYINERLYPKKICDNPIWLIETEKDKYLLKNRIKFCTRCGKQINLCRVCGYPVYPENKDYACGKCGTPLETGEGIGTNANSPDKNMDSQDNILDSSRLGNTLNILRDN
ncbi:MAG: zinc ribbon domain-containing protein [Ferruginibacter sp.]